MIWILNKQKCDIIQDYSEDINAMPKPRMFWPRHIWSKYVNKLEVCFNMISLVFILCELSYKLKSLIHTLL